MIWLTFLPAALALTLGVALGAASLPLHPSWAARLLVTVAATTTVATIGTLVFVTVNYAATLFPRAAARLPEWALFGDDRPVPAALGVPATALTCLGAATAARLSARWAREVRRAQRISQGVVESDTPMALAVPGRDGGVLVSRGLLRALDRAQLRVVFEHEASHLRHRHHHYLALGALAAGTVPPLRRLNTRLRFALERWADEDAAEAIGDRTLVAHTIARVALAHSSRAPEPPPFPAFTGSGVVQRVEALLDTAPGKNTISGPVILGGAALATGLLVSSAWQLDHALGLTFL
ncbi:M56 family metallopeptidase [Actinomadura viridis]|uniref:Zn-dependent protease with chaperone function n=1 Tax=Actinomadura viridis TaxID=58110 RepID=A0A931DKD4_9ACTN|nr:M48 family metalloprotease [Actinomadura viridis]MBG6089161.1 Zn-dependent protease with chaperone function [Actinomadura viridis]